MKLEMAPNSLFAVLLRSPWWVSCAVAAGVVAAARALLPAEWFAAGAFGAAPFAVIGCIAAWRQWRAPDPARVARTIEAIRTMPWDAFRSALAGAYRRDGHEVTDYPGSGADLELTKNGRTVLVACKRWKAARTGVEPLRELRAARDRRRADDCLYVGAGELTDTAVAWAAANGVRLVDGAALAALIPAPTRPSRSS